MYSKLKDITVSELLLQLQNYPFNMDSNKAIQDIYKKHNLPLYTGVQLPKIEIGKNTPFIYALSNMPKHTVSNEKNMFDCNDYCQEDEQDDYQEDEYDYCQEDEQDDY